MIASDFTVPRSVGGPSAVALALLMLVGCGSSSSTPRTTPTTPKPAAPRQSPLLAGNAHPQFPTGPAGQVSVIYQAQISREQTGTASVPIVLDNNSGKAVAHVDVSGTAKDTAGKIVGSGSSQGTSPAAIEPGQWALAYIYFGPDTRVSSSDTMSFNIQTSPADASPFNTAAVQVTQANLSGNSIAGGVQNKTGKEVDGPISVHVYCFDAAGKPIYQQGTYTSGSGALAPDATDSFQITIYGHQCGSHLVGSSGYYK